MTLGDFVTLTEMKDGFTATDRVKELVDAMMEEKDRQLKSSGDATKQWSTVASTIAATKDKDCLDLFVQLDGISLIKQWIEDSQKLGNEPSDNSAEEVITALLHAVEKLHISYEQSVAYGIRETIEKLLSHSSIMVQEKATGLFDSWKQLGTEDAIRGLSGEGHIEPNIEVTLEEKHAKTNDEMVQNVVPGKGDGIDIQTNDDEKTLHHENLKNEGAIIKKPFEENLCNEGEHLPCHLEGNPSRGTSTAVVPNEEGAVCTQLTDNKEQKQEVGNPPDRLDAMEVSPSPMRKGPEPVTGSDLQTDTVMEVDYNPKESETGDMITDLSPSPMENKGIKVDDTRPIQREAIQSEAMVVSQNEGGDCDNKVLDNSGNEDRSPKLGSPDTSSSRGDSDSYNGDSSSGRGLTNKTSFLKTERKDSRMAKKNMSDFELNYGMVDALEVARQVAIEVEREVEGQTESSCNSSVKNLETETKQPNSPGSVCGNETQIDECAPEDNSPKEEELSNGPDIDSSLAPDSEVGCQSKPDKGMVDFDLNQEIFPDDTEHVIETTSAQVSIVSASRAAAAPGLPVSPLEFEGAHGWKGSAATSAFRPASPRKVHDSDKIDDDSKHQRNFLDFDLNMSEDGDDKAAELTSQKQTFHSGESSGEASRLNLDLNRISDEGDAPPSDWRITERHLLSRNNHHNPSPSSSSSSMQQPLRNFDLNDQPTFLNDSSELSFFSKLSSSGKLHSSIGAKSNNNVISIMGTKVEVNHKDLFPQPNGRIVEGGYDVNLARSGGVLGIRSAVTYPHPSVFPYNGHGPTGNFSQIMYGPNGPIPYMIDSRGPQLLGSTSAAPVPYSQPPFNAGIYGMMHPPGFSSPGPSRPNFDLNLGLMGERVNRETGVLRQFLGPGQNRSLDEPRSSFQASSLGKRKEPDGGLWEPYPLDYKHHHPQWK